VSRPVSVAVVSWNTRDLLERCLVALECDHDAGVVEVWVVDNGSTDGSAELVASRFPWVRLVELDENLGFGRSVNEVSRRVDSPWLAASNADVEVRPGALARLIAAGGSPVVGAIAPRLVTEAGVTQHSVHAFPTVSLSLIVNLGLGAVVPRLGDRLCLEGRWNSDRPRDVDWAHGAFLLFRRCAFDEVGGFDPEQWLYAEDIDLAWRLRRSGWSIRYEPAAIVRHAGAASTARAFPRGSLSPMMRATQAWMVRRRGIVPTWVFAAVNTAGALLRWLVLAMLARLRPTRWTHGRDVARGYVAAHRLGLRRRRIILGDAPRPDR
jgi:N-acetylglucosaminyl-diphospho-decaprenol L-rhamnosyltransferase